MNAINLVNKLLNGYNLNKKELEYIKPTIKQLLKDVDKRLKIIDKIIKFNGAKNEQLR